MKVAHTSTTSTEPAQVSSLPRRIPGASGHGKPLGPRPALPAPTIPLTARPLARELANQGWEQAA